MAAKDLPDRAEDLVEMVARGELNAFAVVVVKKDGSVVSAVAVDESQVTRSQLLGAATTLVHDLYSSLFRSHSRSTS